MKDQFRRKPAIIALAGTALLAAVVLPSVILATAGGGADPDRPVESKQRVAPREPVSQQPAAAVADEASAPASPQVSQDAAPQTEPQVAANPNTEPSGVEAAPAAQAAEPINDAPAVQAAANPAVSGEEREPSGAFSIELPELPPDYVQDRGEQPPGTQVGGCFLPPETIEITTPAATERGQRVFEWQGSVRYYLRADGSCLSIALGPGSAPPEFVPEGALNPPLSTDVQQ